MFTRLYWVLLSFTEFYWVLLGFTGFYWVLPSLTGNDLIGFLWVLQDSNISTTSLESVSIGFDLKRLDFFSWARMMMGFLLAVYSNS